MRLPIWHDEHGKPRPTRPCPRCGKEIPINRHAASTLRMLGWRAYQGVSFVEWCGQAVEVILVPEADGWYGEILMLGEAT